MATHARLPRHKIEEMKKKEEERLAREVYEEFVATFEQAPSKMVKTFVRGEVVNADEGASDRRSSCKPRLYLPKPSIVKTESAFEAARRAAEERAKKIMEEAMRNRPQKPGKRKEEKRLSNLEAFKEELKRAQEERAERRRLRQQLQDQLGMEKEPLDKIAPSLDNPYLGTYDLDPNTTNLFLSNLSPKITEEDVCNLFGKYGPLASVKIMWPRSEEERVRGYLTGFVAFMTRRDAERAYTALRGSKHLARNVLGFEMKLSWGKTVPIPQHPVFIPPAMLELTLPPSPSGLPFNAQPFREDRERYTWPLPMPATPPPSSPLQRQLWDKMIRNAVVKVVIPTERSLLCLIHRMVEFVIREGPMFEAMIMNKEINNSMFRFLFDNQSPAHVYYRWKLYSMLQGDGTTSWRTEEFRMFEGGSIWRPPPMNLFHQGMPKELYDEDESYSSPSRSVPGSGVVAGSDSGESAESRDQSPVPSSPPHYSKRGQLSESQREVFEDLLRNITMEQSKVGESMVFCVEHAEAAGEIVQVITESLTIDETPLPKKIARLYLLSDILANCSAKVLNVSYYRKYFGNSLEEIFHSFGKVYSHIGARLKAEQFKQRVMACFRAWEESAIYPPEFLFKLQKVFLGVDLEEGRPGEETGLRASDFDGQPMLVCEIEEKDITSPDSKPLVDYDLDGVPMEDDEEYSQGAPKGSRIRSKAEITDRSPKKLTRNMFVRSKWEEVEPELVEQQAMTSSKWEQLEQRDQPRRSSIAAYGRYDDDLDGVPMEDDYSADAAGGSNDHSRRYSYKRKQEISERKRQLLREIELKVVRYQDDLESGTIRRNRGLTLPQEVELYRERLLRKMNERDDDSRKDRHASEEQYCSKSHGTLSGKRRSDEESDDSCTSGSSSRRKRHSHAPRHSKKSKRSKSGSSPPSQRHRKKKH